MTLAPRAALIAVCTGALLGGGATAPSLADAATPTPFVSELHYDNAGADTGEAVEVTVPAGATVDGWSIRLYNGNGGAPYDSPLALSGTAADAPRAIVVEHAGIQNGAPDGLALVDASGDVVEFLSYEGVVTAVGGPADGRTSTDLGVSESGSEPAGLSLQKEDGVWVGPEASTFGTVNAGGDTGGGPGGGTDPGPDLCAGPGTAVSAVQGSGAASPLEGEAVDVRAVVTQVTPGLDGFFVEEESAQRDDDPATSEGLFVFGRGDHAALQPGDVVGLRGTVKEYYGLTELALDSPATACDLPDETVAATPLRLPADETTRESLEGMLVSQSDLTVTDLFDVYRFGELGLSVGGWLRTPTDVAPVGGGAEEVAQSNAERLIVVDDAGDRDAARATWLGTGDEAVHRLGDRVASVTGSLTYDFGDYKIEPRGDLPAITTANPRPAAPDLAGSGPRVATFNVLNLFNGDGDGGGFPTSRGAGSYQEYLAQRAGIVTAINGLGADVVGIIEVENDYGDGAKSSIAQLVAALDRADDGTVDGSWAYVRPRGLLQDGRLGTDEIATGILYRPGAAKPVGRPASFDVDAYLRDDDGDRAYKTRDPLAASFNLGGRVETLVVNHFKSKGSSCDDLHTDASYAGGGAFAEDPDSDLLGSCNHTRVYAAHRLMDWLGTYPTGVDNGKYLLGGDFNSYSQEPPVQVIEDAGYTDLVAQKGDDEPSYSFDRAVGRLDDLFASPATVGEVEDATVWQVNGVEPYVNLYFAYSGDPYDATGPYASSDHSPVVALMAPRGGGRR